MESGGEISPSCLHKRARVEDAEIPTIQKLQFGSMDSEVPANPPLAPKPASYASTLLKPLGTRILNSEIMIDDFALDEEDVQISTCDHGPNIDFSQKVEDKLDCEWNCAVIVKLMGKPNSENAFKFMLDSLNRKWTTKGPWQLIDIPNGFFIVKFHLAEDMDYVLCNGP